MLNNKKCKNTEISTRHQVLSHDKVEIFWNDTSITNITDLDNFPGYLIQYVPIDDFERREVDENMLFERDICSSFGWKNAQVKQKDVKVVGDTYKFILNNLTQYTTYAYTVQLHFYETAEFDHWKLLIHGASEAQVFKTKMIRPSRVAKFETLIKTLDSITLIFDVISNEKSAIDKFLIHVYEQNYFDPALIDQRDYCLHPTETIETVIELNSLASENKVAVEFDNCCERCCKEKAKAREANDNLRDNLVNLADNFARENPERHIAKMRNLTGFKEEIFIDGNLRNYTVKNLKPFTFYKFHIYACSIESTCSEYEILIDKTAHNEKFDRVILSPQASDQKNKFTVYFEEPKIKNGAIVKYIVQLLEIKENSTNLAHSECITRKQHEEMGNR